MEKRKSIGVMRELFKALLELGTQLTEQYGITLTASVISRHTGLSALRPSKVIHSIEEELIVGSLCNKDKRQMYFMLSNKGREYLMQHGITHNQ